MGKEVTLIMIIVVLGVLVLALTIAVVWLSKKVIGMSDRVSTFDDYLLTKFISNHERTKQNEDGRTGEST